MVFDFLVGLYIYFVLAYLLSWTVVHRTKFDCLCEMTQPLRRLLVTSAGPFFPLGIIVAMAVALPFALPYGLFYVLLTWVPPFTYLRRGVQWAMKKQEEEIEQIFNDKTKKDYLEYMSAQTPKEVAETKEWLRGQGLYYVLDEEEPTFRIKISHEVPIILSELVEDAKKLGGTDFSVDYSTNSAHFLGTPSILQKMRNTSPLIGLRGDEVIRVTGD